MSIEYCLEKKSSRKDKVTNKLVNRYFKSYGKKILINVFFKRNIEDLFGYFLEIRTNLSSHFTIFL